MSKLLRMSSVAALAALTLAATPAAAAPVGPAPNSRNATATARIIKPLTLTWVQDLSLGDILQSGTGAWSESVGITQGGTFNCSNVNVTCSGTTSVARYRVTGTNNQRVFITAPNVTMVNQNDNTKTLTMTVDKGLGYVDLSNSGNSGVEFALGGSITVTDQTVDGVYRGNFNVTVDY